MDRAGWHLTGGLANVERVIDAKPDIILIEFSINDAFIEKRISLDESMQNYRSIIRKIRDGGTKPVEIYLMTMNFTIGDIEKARPNHAKYYELYRHLATEEEVRLIDKHALARKADRRARDHGQAYPRHDSPYG